MFFGAQAGCLGHAGERMGSPGSPRALQELRCSVSSVLMLSQAELERFLRVGPFLQPSLKQLPFSQLLHQIRKLSHREVKSGQTPYAERVWPGLGAGGWRG